MGAHHDKEPLPHPCAAPRSSCSRRQKSPEQTGPLYEVHLCGRVTGSEPRLAFNRIVVLRNRSYLESRQLAPGTVNLRLGAVRRLAYEAADCGLISSDLAASIRRVKGGKKLGVRLGNWLTAEEAHSLWQAPDSQGLEGKRDRALLALACGLMTYSNAKNTGDCRFTGQGRPSA